MADVVGGSPSSSPSADLNSSSSYADAKAVYLDNADYEEENSVSKAKAFRKACRYLQFLTPKRVKQGESREIEIDPKILPNEIQMATAFIQAVEAAGTNGRSGPPLGYVNLECFNE